MTKPKMALGPWHKRSLYAATALAWLSGGLWLADKYFRQAPSDFGLQAPATQAWWLELHGAAAMALLVILGSLLPEHVRLGWRRKARRPSGGFLLGVCGFLAVTGWGLYYVGDQALRRYTSLAHWSVGLALPLAIALHVILSARKSVTAASERRAPRSGSRW